MTKDEFIQAATIAIIHATLSRESKYDTDNAISLASRLAEKLYKDETPAKPVTAKRTQAPAADESELVFPYTSDDFMKVWRDLIKRPKWRKKDNKSLQYSLDKLAKYEEAFAIILMANAISGNYQGLVFSSTEDEYNKWLVEQGKGTIFGQKPQNRRSSTPESKTEQNFRAAAEAAAVLMGDNAPDFNDECYDNQEYYGRPDEQ